MERRKCWTSEEVRELLTIVKEQNILKLDDGKKYRSISMFKNVERDLKRKNIHCSAKQIRSKLKTMKNHFFDIKKNKISDANKLEIEHMDLLEKIFEVPSQTRLKARMESTETHGTLPQSNITLGALSDSEEAESPRSPSPKNKSMFKYQKLLRQQQMWMKEELEEQRKFEKKMLDDFMEMLNKSMQEFAQTIGFEESASSDSGEL